MLEYCAILVAPAAAGVATSSAAFAGVGVPAGALAVVGAVAAIAAGALMWGLSGPCRSPALARPASTFAGLMIAPALVYALSVGDPSHRAYLASVAPVVVFGYLYGEWLIARRDGPDKICEIVMFTSAAVMYATLALVVECPGILVLLTMAITGWGVVIAWWWVAEPRQPDEPCTASKA